MKVRVFADVEAGGIGDCPFAAEVEAVTTVGGLDANGNAELLVSAERFAAEHRDDVVFVKVDVVATVAISFVAIFFSTGGAVGTEVLTGALFDGLALGAGLGGKVTARVASGAEIAEVVSRGGSVALDDERNKADGGVINVGDEVFAIIFVNVEFVADFVVFRVGDNRLSVVAFGLEMAGAEVPRADDIDAGEFVLGGFADGAIWTRQGGRWVGTKHLGVFVPDVIADEVVSATQSVLLGEEEDILAVIVGLSDDFGGGGGVFVKERIGGVAVERTGAGIIFDDAGTDAGDVDA